MSRLQDAMSDVRSNPYNPNAWTNLGDLLMGDGQIEKARQSYQRALQLDHENEAAQLGLANTLTATPPTTVPQEAPSPPYRSSEELRTRDLKADAPLWPQEPGEAPSEEEEELPADDFLIIDDDELLGSDTITFSGDLPESEAIDKAAPTFRDPPPMPEKPSRGRLWLGIGILMMIPSLCLCTLLGLVAYIF